jgi:hypothetical protein
MSKFLIIWNAIVTVAKVITRFTKTKKDEEVVEKLDDIVENCATITEEDVAKLKEVTKKNVEKAKEIKNVLKK